MIENLVYEAPLGKSDHAVLHFTFICQLPSAPPSIKVQYEKGNYTKLNEVLSRVDWISEFSKYPNDVEKQWSYFKDKYEEPEKTYVPRKIVHLNRKVKKKFSIPLDRENLRKIKKNRLWTKIRKDLASVEEKLQFNQLRNQIRRLTQKAPRANNCKKYKIESQSVLEVHPIKTQISLKHPRHYRTCAGTETDPKYAKCDEDKAKVFLDYFSSVFTVEADQYNLPFFENEIMKLYWITYISLKIK